MRIVHVTDCYLPRLGGIEMHVHDLVRQQRRDGHDARILTITPAGTPAGTKAITPAGEGAGVDPSWVHRVRHSSSAVPRQIGVARLIATLLADADVVHVHVSVISPFAFGAARQAAALGLPTLVTVHSLWSRLGVLPAFGSAVTGLGSWPVQWSAVSECAAEPLRRVLGTGVPVIVLPNAVDPADWQVEPREPVTPTIVSVMRLARIKRPLPLARMLRQVRAAVPEESPLRAVIIGDGPQRARLERYLDRHQMRGWVELPGRLERSAIRETFAGASVYVAPAEQESFGIAALEARCAGLPVVASSHGGVGAFITSGVDGLMADTDEAMVAAMVRLVSDAPYAAAIAAHNRTELTDLGWPTACARSMHGYERAARIADARRTPALTALTAGRLSR